MKFVSIFKRFAAAMTLAVVMYGAASAAVVNVTSNITSNTTWSNNNTYVLFDKIFVKNGATLTIEAGTIIKGDKSTKGALIITRDGMIDAQGTACQPIVFTSDQAAGSRAAGDWGGLLILGEGIVNTASGTGIIEGGFTAPDGEYGGSNAADNSGILSYVRIEFCGIAFTTNNETNGLTMGGVGSGTTIDHVMVAYAGDDGFEWFGGSVNCKYLVSHRVLDDDYDTDFGFNGMVQFAVAIRAANTADVSGSNAFESDNDGTGSNNTPNTKPLFSNVTILGPSENGTPNSNYRRAFHIRRNSRCSIYNSVACGFPTGIFIDGSSSQNAATANDLQMENSVIANMTSNYNSTFEDTYYNDAGRNNEVYANTSSLGFITNYNSITNPKLAVSNSSILLSGADFSNSRLTDPFFTSVSYRGAFDDGCPWTDRWCDFSPQNNDYTSGPIAIAPVVTNTPNNIQSACASPGLTIEAFTCTPGVTYQWMRGASLAGTISGATNSTYTATVSNSYLVRVTDPNCPAAPYAVSDTVFLTINPLPTATATFVNYNVACAGDTIWMMANTNASSPSYQWQRKVGTNYNNIPGETNNTYGSAVTNNFKVRVTDGVTGCVKLSPAVVATVSTPSSKATVSACSGGSRTLMGSTNATNFGPATYQWMRSSTSNGNFTNVNGATNLNYTTNVSGYYKLMVTRVDGCTKLSSQYVITNASLNCRFGGSADVETASISVFPNPATDVMMVNFTATENTAYTFNVVDMLGKVVATDRFDAASGENTYRLNVSNITPGVYMLEVKGATTEMVKFVVTK